MADKFEKIVIAVLLVIDAVGLIISMIAGPLGHTAICTGAAISSAIISVAVVMMGFARWKDKDRF